MSIFIYHNQNSAYQMIIDIINQYNKNWARWMNKCITDNIRQYYLQNIGVSVFRRDELTMQCGLIQYYIPTSRTAIKKLIDENKPEIILTNNDKHIFIQGYNHSKQQQQQNGGCLANVKMMKIDERGLEDDIIQNNINLLRFSPIKPKISNKSQYIKLMKDHSESMGSGKEKYKSLGMMLYYLLNEDSISIISKLYLNDIQYFFDFLFKTVQIGNSQLQAFQIIKEEVHPSLIKGKGRSKQGFSILNLYQTTLSSNGAKKILRHIFRNPSYDRNILEKRSHLIDWIKRNIPDYNSFLKIFRSIHSIDTILRKFIQSRVQIEDWQKLTKTLQSMIILHKQVQEKVRSGDERQIPSFVNWFFCQINWMQIARILSSITSNLDLEEGFIKRGVDIQLDQLKKTYDNLPHLLTLYARQQNWNEDNRIVFMAQIGYLIRVPHQVQVPEDQKSEWVLQFVKNSGKFYCNQLTNMLDNEYGDIYGEITDREKKITFQLQNIVSQFSQSIQKAYWACCQFQCFVGIAIVSNGMCKPRLSSETLIISKGWHLLIAQDAIQNHAFSFNQNLAPKEKVFNSQQNLVNTNYSNRMMIITGPNGSGKTVYMKQTMVIIYLTHLGFFVPAQFAEIPLCDKFAFVQSKRSIYKTDNGFQSQIASLSKIMTPGLLTNKTLVLIDELGSSIDTILSKRILYTVIKYLSDPKLESLKNFHLSSLSDRFEQPLSLIITHLTDISSQAIIEENYMRRYLTMDMEKYETFLFKIKPGLVKKGYGIECAKAFMQPHFIRRAIKFWEDNKYKQQLKFP